MINNQSLKSNLLNLGSNIQNIQQRVSETRVETYHISLNDRTYLAIANVNTDDIAKKIRKLTPQL